MSELCPILPGELLLSLADLSPVHDQVIVVIHTIDQN
jgi:hypothetical protein